MTQHIIKAERVDFSERWILTVYDDFLDEVFERDVEDKKEKKE